MEEARSGPNTWLHVQSKFHPQQIWRYVQPGCHSRSATGYDQSRWGVLQLYCRVKLQVGSLIFCYQECPAAALLHHHMTDTLKCAKGQILSALLNSTKFSYKTFHIHYYCYRFYSKMWELHLLLWSIDWSLILILWLVSNCCIVANKIAVCFWTNHLCSRKAVCFL